MNEKGESKLAVIEQKCHRLLVEAVRLSIRQGGVVIDKERCKGCGMCVATCPGQTLSLSAGLNRRGYSYSQQVRETSCIGCASCALVCPDACITVYRDGIF